MPISESALFEILRIGHATSIRSSEGLSLNQALARAGYATLRSQIDREGILSLLRKHPRLVDEWVMYSEDKRTSGGWYIRAEEFEIGRVGLPDSEIKFARLDEAVAEYVLRELDYWAGIRGAT